MQMFGVDFPQVLGGTETALGQTSEALNTTTEELRTLATEAGVSEEYLQIFGQAMMSQGGIVSGLQAQFASFMGTFTGLGEALREETDLTDEQIKQLQWEEFGDHAQGLANAFKRLGLEVPPALQELLDYGAGLEDTSEVTTTATSEIDQYSDSIIRMIRAYGLVGDEAHVFAQAMQSSGSFVQDAKNNALTFLGAMNGIFEDLRDNTNLSLLERNTLMWGMFGEEARRTAARLRELGIAIPPTLQEFLDFGAGLEDVTDTTTEATVAVEQYSDRILNLANSFGLVGPQVDAFGQAMQAGIGTCTRDAEQRRRFGRLDAGVV